MRLTFAALALVAAAGTVASATPAQICVPVNGTTYCFHSPIDPR